jgi:hypothetical protein
MEDMTKDQCSFAVFCIESLAKKLNIPGYEVYALLTEKSDVLDGYILPFYDTLHTQGEEYIVRELLEVLGERGVEV